MTTVPSRIKMRQPQTLRDRDNMSEETAHYFADPVVSDA